MRGRPAASSSPPRISRSSASVAISRLPRRSTAPRSCSSIVISGSAAGSRWRSRACERKWSRRSAISFTSAISYWWTRPFSRERSASTPGRSSPPSTSIARVRAEVVQAIRDFFSERHFVLVDTPILSGAIGEHAGTLFATEYFDLGKAYLARTGQLYVEAAAAALGKVYCFGPTFRAEKSKTRRHLTEFWMVEPE